MVKVISGVDDTGRPLSLYLDGYLKNALDVAIDRVKGKNWDYVALVCGLPGSGKSTFARTCARYCCPWFDLNHICFTASEFIDVTNKCPEYSSVVLDESFQSLNTRTSMTTDFIRIVNHLQLIRQKHLFIFLCLPNFFDLSKGISIFRSSHLFLIYAEDNGDRGKFVAFGRDTKRQLYIQGNKYIDYNCVKGNFVGRFVRNKGIIDEKKYDERKYQHLQDQNLKETSIKFDRDAVIMKLRTIHKWKTKEIGELIGLDRSQVSRIIIRESKNGVL